MSHKIKTKQKHQSAINTDTMKKPIKTIKTNILLLIFFLFFGIGATAQGPSLPGTGDGNNDIQDEAPISSLLIVGLIAGAAYGYKKLK